MLIQGNHSGGMNISVRTDEKDKIKVINNSVSNSNPTSSKPTTSGDKITQELIKQYGNSK